VLAAAPSMKPSKRRDLLIEHADKARISRELVTLRADAPMPLPLDALVVKQPDPAHLAAWLARRASAARSAGWAWRTRRRGKPRNRPKRPMPAAAGTGDVERRFGGPTRPSRRRMLARLGRGRARRGCSRWTPRPTGWMRCARIWSDCRWRPRPGHACYVPLRHDILAEQIPLADAIEMLVRCSTDPAVLKVLQNAKFDMMVLGAPASRRSRRSTTPC
jgi:DNA polymerase-1